MRNVTLLDGVDASSQQISTAENLDKRTEWKLLINSSGLDGIPQLFIEQGFNGGKCFGEPNEWSVLTNKCDDTGVFLIDDAIITVNASSFKGNWFRVRLEANGNTTGTVTARLGYKDFP